MTSNAYHNDGSIITFPGLHEFLLSDISGELEEAVEQSVMPALRTLHVTMTRYKPLTLLNHTLQTSPLLEDFFLEVNTSERELRLRHDQIRKFVFINGSYGGGGCDWKDDDLDWIGSSFPGLQDLTAYGGSFFKHRTTWRTLPSLAAQFSENLRRLEITLYVGSFNLSDVVPWDITLSSLRTLTFSQLKIKEADLDPFSKYLAALFPNVETLEINDFHETSVKRPKRQPGTRLFSEVEKGLFIGKFFEYKAGRHTMKEMIGGGVM
ncbi:hypothetical protein FRB95_007341 [Tulasnella sp. JGI-2019a]|nr:hypothetical protein FRB95_007341 [Tulasnella sp. JGI-2019a]